MSGNHPSTPEKSQWHNANAGPVRVYQRGDPQNPKRLLKTWWIDYHVDGRRYRESSKSRRKSDAVALLKRRMGEHATGQYVGAEAKRLTFEDLEAGHRGELRAQGAPFAGPPPGQPSIIFRNTSPAGKRHAIMARALETYAADRLK